MPRVTAQDIGVELEKHEIQCGERWTQNWNRLKKIEEQVKDLAQVIGAWLALLVGGH